MLLTFNNLQRSRLHSICYVDSGPQYSTPSGLTPMTLRYVDSGPQHRYLSTAPRLLRQLWLDIFRLDTDDLTPR
jgi:hypothetical protein